MANKSVIKSHSEREIDLLRPYVKKIDVLRPMTAMMSDEELKNKHLEFKERLAKGETLDDLIVDAFAVVREAAARVRHTPHYPEQIMGGLLMHQGRVAQMRTGEGKTQTCLLPAYLNALDGQGVHVITCNDYLSARDAEDMAKVHNFLGLTVGSITQQSTTEERKEAYACDITYVTNSELAFDYLRDNMAIYKEDQVLRGLHYCIIDEVDSVLIDEARMPLRISGKNDKDLSLYVPADEFVKSLEQGVEGEERSKLDYIFKTETFDTGDYVINEKDNIINLTDQGIKKAEEYFQIENLADPENLEILHHINLALRANFLLVRDDDYMVKDDQVMIIDEFTGRASPGRKFSDGLHQALEAKEGLKINKGTITIANVTYQNFFNKYDKKGGMTGTGLSEEREFRDVYSMDVVEVPTHRPVQRIDLPDAVYCTRAEKLAAVIEEVKKAHAKRQPVLVGTITVEQSEEISEMLKAEGIEHNVLNAKLLELEAEIVSHSGEAGAVTIATSMAGRGTDIKINAEARAVGGLKVIGTERYDSRRVDDQLRGRSGRQGDVGESQFIVSLEDELLKNFGSERLIEMFTSMGFEYGHKLQHKSLHKTIEAAQHRLEYNNYGSRKNTLDYDQVLNDQREIVYEERERILTHDNVHPSVCRMIEHIINDSIDMVVRHDSDATEWDFDELNALILPIIPLKPISYDRLEGYDKQSLQIQLKLEALNLYESKLEDFAQTKNMSEIEKVVLLKCIDSKWTRHIDDMDQLKQGIHLEQYSGKDPLTQFKIYAYNMFDEMIRGIREDAIYILYRARFGRDVQREQVARIVDNIGGNRFAQEEEAAPGIQAVDEHEYDHRLPKKEKKTREQRKQEKAAKNKRGDKKSANKTIADENIAAATSIDASDVVKNQVEPKAEAEEKIAEEAQDLLQKLSAGLGENADNSGALLQKVADKPELKPSEEIETKENEAKEVDTEDDYSGYLIGASPSAGWTKTSKKIPSFDEWTRSSLVDLGVAGGEKIELTKAETEALFGRRTVIAKAKDTTLQSGTEGRTHTNGSITAAGATKKKYHSTTNIVATVSEQEEMPQKVGVPKTAEGHDVYVLSTPSSGWHVSKKKK